MLTYPVETVSPDVFSVSTLILSVYDAHRPAVLALWNNGALMLKVGSNSYS